MRILPPLLVGPEDVVVLRSWVDTGEPRSAATRRASIVLLAAAGLGTAAIAEHLGCSRQTVITWRERFRADGVDGLRDAPRSGRPATLDEAAVVARTLQAPPGPAGTRWSTRRLAAELGISNAAVAAVWRAHGIRPGVDSVRFGTDPVLDTALDGIAGVYVSAPTQVLALQVRSTDGPGPTVQVPVGDRPDVRVALAAATTAAAPVEPANRLTVPGPARVSGDDGHRDLSRFLAALPAERLALVVQPAAALLREWADQRPAVTLHVVPAGLVWTNIAPLMCAVVARTPLGASSVADLAKALEASPAGRPISWTR